MANYRPLTLGLIEQGQLERDFNEEFLKVQQRLCAYVDAWGERAGKAKAEVTLKLTMVADRPEDFLFSVKGSITHKLPSRPARITSCFSDKGEDGQPCLFSRASGTTPGEVRQAVIFTDDGKPVDPATGEVMEPTTVLPAGETGIPVQSGDYPKQEVHNGQQ